MSTLKAKRILNRPFKVKKCEALRYTEHLSASYTDADTGLTHEEVSNTQLDLTKLLMQLPRRERTAILLYVDGYTQREIGKRYNISTQRTNQIIESGLRQLRKELTNPAHIKYRWDLEQTHY